MLHTKFGESRASVGQDLAAAMLRSQCLIHATPTGMANHPGLPLPADLLRKDLIVAEIVYFPLETELLKTARSLGCHTIDGSGMAIYQAADAFHWFTGLDADARRMREVFASFDAR
jgi:shikimate dehydrogenase